MNTLKSSPWRFPPPSSNQRFFGACLNVLNYQLNPNPSDFTGNVLPSLSPDLRPARSCNSATFSEQLSVCWLRTAGSTSENMSVCSNIPACEETLAAHSLGFIVHQAQQSHQNQQMNLSFSVLHLVRRACNLTHWGQLLQIFTFSSVLMYLLNLLNASILNFISSPRRSK